MVVHLAGVAKPLCGCARAFRWAGVAVERNFIDRLSSSQLQVGGVAVGGVAVAVSVWWYCKAVSEVYGSAVAAQAV